MDYIWINCTLYGLYKVNILSWMLKPHHRTISCTFVKNPKKDFNLYLTRQVTEKKFLLFTAVAWQEATFWGKLLGLNMATNKWHRWPHKHQAGSLQTTGSESEMWIHDTLFGKNGGIACVHQLQRWYAALFNLWCDHGFHKQLVLVI